MFNLCSVIYLSKNLHHIEPNQMICIANELAGFYIIQVFTERFFQTDFSREYLYLVKMNLSI